MGKCINVYISLNFVPGKLEYYLATLGFTLGYISDLVTKFLMGFSLYWIKNNFAPQSLV